MLRILTKEEKPFYLSIAINNQQKLFYFIL